MKMLTSYLRFLPASQEPLSADIYIIEGDRYSYIFDVGNNEESLSLISNIKKDKVIILSHPHNDHVGNIDKIEYQSLYVGDATFDKIRKGIIVKDKLVINDGVKLEVMHCPSPHTPGSLIVTVNNEYTLLADLYFTKPDFDREEAQKMMAALNKLDTKYFVASHQEEQSVFSKDFLLDGLAEYFK